MSVDHLDVLHSEIPELFQPRDLSPTWDDGIIVVPIDNPEAQFSDSLAPPKWDPETLNCLDLENLAAEPTTEISVPPSISPEILDALGGAHPGAPVPRVDPNKMPPPDCFAFYLPFHYYHPTWWGVYLLLEGVHWLASEVVSRAGGRVNMRDAVCAARMFLYYHEAFHHKTECFATRMEITHRKPFYKTGFERLFQRTVGTDNCLEEGLANASALDLTWKVLRSKDIEQALTGYVKDCPPGYRRGVEIRRDMTGVRCQFAEDNQNFCLPHIPKKNPEVWRTTPHMFNGISNVGSRVNYVISRNSPLVVRMRVRPSLPPSKLVKKLQELVRLEFVRNGGNHDIYRTPSGKQTSIPRHPRDLSPSLLRNIIRQVGLNMSVSQFMQQ